MLRLRNCCAEKLLKIVCNLLRRQGLVRGDERAMTFERAVARSTTASRVSCGALTVHADFNGACWSLFVWIGDVWWPAGRAACRSCAVRRVLEVFAAAWRQQQRRSSMTDPVYGGAVPIQSGSEEIHRCVT